MRANFLSPGLLGPALGLTLLACAGGDLNLPSDNTPDDAPVELVAVSGDGQEGRVGSELPKPLVVRVRNAAGRPVAQVPLAFRFQNEFPDAEINPATVETDSTGLASVRVRLGTTSGSQTIEATIAQDAAPDVRATFGVTALDKHGRRGDGGAGDDE